MVLSRQDLEKRIIYKECPMWEKIFEEIKRNIKNPKMYAAFLIVFVMFFVLFPYLDANIFYYKRVINRVDILKKVAELDMEKISKDEVLYDEYQGILQEIETQPQGMISSLILAETDPVMIRIKFISGGVLFWILCIACLFVKNMKNWGYRLIGVIVCFILGLILGAISKSIPNIFNPWVNIIGFPIVQIAIIALIFSSNKKKSKTKNANSDSVKM